MGNAWCLSNQIDWNKPKKKTMGTILRDWEEKTDISWLWFAWAMVTSVIMYRLTESPIALALFVACVLFPPAKMPAKNLEKKVVLMKNLRR